MIRNSIALFALLALTWLVASKEQHFCPPGLTGPGCSVPVCFGFPAFSWRACSGTGRCIAPNRCACRSVYHDEVCRPCPPGYGGRGCRSAVCFGRLAWSPFVCGGNGVCTAPDTCSCNIGFAGEECFSRTPMISCFGRPIGDPLVCAGHGTCEDLDRCTCNPQWTGERCDVPVCFGIAAGAPGVCGGFGRCEAPDTCICNEGYQGSQCGEQLAPAPLPSPPSDVPPPTAPDVFTCGGIASTDSTVCSGHGTCTAQDTCTCQAGWTGTNCETPVCFSLAATDANVCSGRGTCSAPDTCTCQTGFTGDQCQTAEDRCLTTNCPAGEICCNDFIAGPLCYRTDAHTCTDVGGGRFRFCCCPTCLPCGTDYRCYNNQTHRCVNNLVLPL